MKLTYRGVSYSYNPPEVKASDAIAAARYRGAAYRLRQALSTIAQQPGLDLKYRGVEYTTLPEQGGAANPEAVPAVAMVATPSVKAGTTEAIMRSLAMHHHRAAKQREQVMLSRIADQVGLNPDFAAHYWNPIQGKIGHDALDTYDRSHAAFS